MGKSRATLEWPTSDDALWMAEGMTRSVGFDPAGFRFVTAALLRQLPVLVQDPHEIDELDYLTAVADGLDASPPGKWKGARWGRFQARCRRTSIRHLVPGDLLGDDPSEEVAEELIELVTVRGAGDFLQFLEELLGMFSGRGTEPDWNRTQRAGADFLREVFGPPVSRRGRRTMAPLYVWQPRPLPADWKTDTVLALARQMWGSRDFAAMPILADALQDAGCDREDVLAHCRAEAPPHCRGCWVIDAILPAATV